MLIEYINEALSKANYEIIEDEEPFYADIPELPGVWAQGKSFELCRRNLYDVIEGWLIVSLRQGLPIPVLNNIDIFEEPEILV